MSINHNHRRFIGDIHHLCYHRSAINAIQSPFFLVKFPFFLVKSHFFLVFHKLNDNFPMVLPTVLAASNDPASLETPHASCTPVSVVDDHGYGPWVCLKIRHHPSTKIDGWSTCSQKAYLGVYTIFRQPI